MHTSTQFAIGVHLLALLAQAGSTPQTSERLAQSVNTHPVFIRRILGEMHRAGLVGSQPGVRGGWHLTQPAEAITLLDVYRAVEAGSLLALHHSSPSQQCPVGRNIGATLRELFAGAESAFEQSLARQSVAGALARTLALAEAQAM